ncbi:MAG TPA: ribonuclease HII [Stellaceae bacterium]
MPSFRIERTLTGVICGIDEVGRGPLAGPVVAAAVILPQKLPRGLRGAIDDSKRMSRQEREAVGAILVGVVQYGIGAASAAEIDRINILRATFLAMARALAALMARGHRPDWALVDGNQAPPLTCPVKTVIGGDGLSLSIAAASIIAKVTRDRAMRALAARYPVYRWETNVGYGTEEHRGALAAHGPTRHHRRSFSPLQLALELESNEL